MKLENRIHTIRCSALPPDEEYPTLIFESLNYQEQLGRPFKAVLNAFSLKDDLDGGSLIGRPMNVQIKLESDKKRYVDGIVTSFENLGAEEFAGDTFCRYLVELRPWFWLLTLSQNFRIFQEKSCIEIFRIIFSDHRFTDFSDQTKRSFEKREYCCQYRESDFNFVSRLMEEEGIYYCFEHLANSHKMKLVHTGACQAAAVPVPFRSHGTYKRDEDYLSKWSSKKEVHAVKCSLQNYDFENPNVNLLELSPTTQSEQPHKFEVYDYPGDFLTGTVGQKLAKIRREEAAVDAAQYRGSSNSLDITTGCVVKVQDLPVSKENAEYLVTGLNATFASPDQSLMNADRSVRQLNFTAIPKTVQFRPKCITPPPVVTGPQSAVVVGKSGEEIWTDKYGRIRIQFPWDREGKKNEQSTCWVRVSQAWAGQGFGSIHLPRIGQEVLVEFISGDPDRPIVTGRVYNKEQNVPYPLPNNMTQSGILSKATKNGKLVEGNQLRFEDKKSKEEIYLHATKDFKQETTNDQTVTVEEGNLTTKVLKGKHETTVKKDCSTTVEQGDIKIKASTKKIMIEAQQSIELKVGTSSIKLEPAKITLKSTQIDVKGNLGVKVSGANVKINGSAATDVAAGGIVKVQGALVKIN
ncbi:MAG: type VI secretion system tip protein TssI/VgrG [Planctomycetota bacterium]|nr:type VI secretion system tip protein TssI/VgrG [Planctomycetota bacterium]